MESKEPPKVSFSEDKIEIAGFTDSGKTGFKKTVSEYSDMIFNKATGLADVHKADDCLREVTHEHVKAAAIMIASNYGKPRKRRWLVFTQILEYIGTAIAGWSTVYLKETWGIQVFVVTIATVVILMVLRLIKESAE